MFRLFPSLSMFHRQVARHRVFICSRPRDIAELVIRHPRCRRTNGRAIRYHPVIHGRNPTSADGRVPTKQKAHLRLDTQTLHVCHIYLYIEVVLVVNVGIRGANRWISSPRRSKTREAHLNRTKKKCLDV